VYFTENRLRNVFFWYLHKIERFTGSTQTTESVKYTEFCCLKLQRTEFFHEKSSIIKSQKFGALFNLVKIKVYLTGNNNLLLGFQYEQIHSFFPLPDFHVNESFVNENFSIKFYLEYFYF
jgi:hypothetical protein